MEIINNRRKWKWTKHQLDKLNKVETILEELENYRPLTLRQIYYQLVGKGYIENKVSEYTMLSGLLKNARLSDKVSWEDMMDRTRARHDYRGWDNSTHFINSSFRSFLDGYRRNLVQSQDKYLEIWIEKDALSSIFTQAVAPYTLSVTVCKGFSSVSFLNDYKERLSWYSDKQPIIHYYGDFDPSGVEMLKSMEITLRDELKVEGIQFKRIALSKEDIFQYKLPHSPDAIKKSDTRTKAHVAEFGELAVELDALSPAVLEAKIKTAIESELDLVKFNNEKDINREELDKLNKLRIDIMEYAYARKAI